jgi:hypothetical protein
MALYTNNTRFSAIVTVDVSGVVDPKNALKIIAVDAADRELEASVGHHDLLVEAGKTLDVMQGTTATLFAVRSCP